jgi:hypothetical protein
MDFISSRDAELLLPVLLEGSPENVQALKQAKQFLSQAQLSPQYHNN